MKKKSLEIIIREKVLLSGVLDEGELLSYYGRASDVLEYIQIIKDSNYSIDFVKLQRKYNINRNEFDEVIQLFPDCIMSINYSEFDVFRIYFHKPLD